MSLTNATESPGNPSSEGKQDALDQAIAWKLEHDGTETLPPARQRAFQTWLKSHATHRAAWEKLAQMDAALAHLDTPARSVLARHRRQARPGRHAARTMLALALLFGGAAALHSQRPLTALTADYATSTATTAMVMLPDGSHLNLDARSAVDISFTDTERLVRLRMGSILVETSTDAANRPFIVESRYGRMRALGTRFLVETDNKGTRLTVLEHAVQATAEMPEREIIVQSGQALRIAPDTPFTLTTAPRDADAWVDGMLVAHDVPLEMVIEHLGRYRSGRLHLDPALAKLSVSGTFSLRDTDRSLLALSAQLPIRIRRFSQLWVDILPARTEEEIR
ncbi:FecR domain-containing protein [Kerstersia similis]|uniref:FecR domain-containing protein n=1 Tax=Kerstersia similis TaxID=206505 RepID=UPI0039F0A926